MSASVHELSIITDEHFNVPAVWFNFVMHVNGASKNLDYDSHVTMLNQELTKWKGSRQSLGKISFPDAESLAAFVLAWS